MRTYVKNRQSAHKAQVLNLYWENNLYYPVIQHTTIDQDRPFGKKTTFREHSHDLYHLIIYTQSQGYFSKCGQLHKAIPGTMVVISPGQLHDFISRREGAIYSEVTFSLESSQHTHLKIPIEKVLSLYAGVKLKFKQNPIRLERDPAKELELYMIQLMDFLQSNSPWTEFYTQKTLGQIFDFIITNCCCITNRKAAEINNNIVRVKQFIDSHYSKQLNMSELAEMAHVSKSYFFRVFKNNYATTPLAYQQNLRIEAAKTLLKVTALRCNEIGRRVGYDNIYMFYRIFKKAVGMSPREFRNNPWKRAHPPKNQVLLK